MERRATHYDALSDAVADAERLLASGYDRAGRWTLAQVACHLATVIEMSRRGFPWYLPWPLTAFARWFAMGPVLRREVFRIRMPAPQFLQPPVDADDRAGVDRLRAAVALFEGPGDTVFPSPVFGRLTREQWRQVHLWHCEHHFSFLVPRAAACPIPSRALTSRAGAAASLSGHPPPARWCCGWSARPIVTCR